MRIPAGVLSLALPFAAAFAPAAAMEETRRAETFRDWVVGCDGRGMCRALGLPAEGAPIGAFLVASSGGPATSFELHLAASREEDPAQDEATKAPRQVAVRVVGAGRELYRGIWTSHGRWHPDHDAASSHHRDRDAVQAAVLAGESLEIEGEGLSVSLLGATAALLRMDEALGKVGTTAAVVAKGPQSWAPPRVPVRDIPSPVEALTALDPPPPPPATPPFEADPGCADRPPFVVEASDGTRIWGLCETAANVNQLNLFWAEDEGGLRPLAFPGPGRGGEPLVANPMLEDEMALASFDRARGLGDCGEFSRWLWTGGAPFLVTYAEMPLCRGVPAEAWPRLLDMDYMP